MCKFNRKNANLTGECKFKRKNANIKKCANVIRIPVKLANSCLYLSLSCYICICPIKFAHFFIFAFFLLNSSWWGRWPRPWPLPKKRCLPLRPLKGPPRTCGYLWLKLSPLNEPPEPESNAKTLCNKKGRGQGRGHHPHPKNLTHNSHQKNM
jgi:hypothetical protein